MAGAGETKPLKPHMEPDEIDRLKFELDRCERFVEFGCGGSTRIAAQSGAGRIWSIDNQKAWVERCREEPAIAERTAQDRATIVFVDTGPTRQWGYPESETRLPGWEAYSTCVWPQLQGPPDLVLIDGRWRRACFLQTLLHCADDCRILVHDWAGRSRYHKLLRHASVVGLVDQLAILLPNPVRDRATIARAAAKAVNDPS